MKEVMTRSHIIQLVSLSLSHSLLDSEHSGISHSASANCGTFRFHYKSEFPMYNFFIIFLLLRFVVSKCHRVVTE